MGPPKNGEKNAFRARQDGKRQERGYNRPNSHCNPQWPERQTVDRKNQWDDDMADEQYREPWWTIVGMDLAIGFAANRAAIYLLQIGLVEGAISAVRALSHDSASDGCGQSWHARCGYQHGNPPKKAFA